MCLVSKILRKRIYTEWTSGAQYRSTMIAMIEGAPNLHWNTAKREITNTTIVKTASSNRWLSMLPPPATLTMGSTMLQFVLSTIAYL